MGWTKRDDAVEAVDERRKMAVRVIKSAIRRKSAKAMKQALVEYARWFRVLPPKAEDKRVEDQFLDALSHIRFVWEDRT